jgi:hypothetical protein
MQPCMLLTGTVTSARTADCNLAGKLQGLWWAYRALCDCRFFKWWDALAGLSLTRMVLLSS